MEMTIHRALAFLRSHQPMPADDVVNKAEIEELDLVRRFLTEYPDDAALDLLLGVFGEGSGFGVYQLIENAVAAHSNSVVVPVLARKLQNGSRSVRYWCAQLATHYPDDRLVGGLSVGLSPDDFDLRWAAVTALASIKTDAAREALQNWLPQETDDELRATILDASP